MQLRLKPRPRNQFRFGKTIIKISLAVVVILAVTFFLGKLDLPAEKKVIKHEISNDKLIKLK